jgi:hypothetical protein
MRLLNDIGANNILQNTLICPSGVGLRRVMVVER